MAVDLGLNRHADKWQYRGADLFNAEEKQLRKQIWFGCVIADEYSAVYMGRSSSTCLCYVYSNPWKGDRFQLARMILTRLCLNWTQKKKKKVGNLLLVIPCKWFATRYLRE